MKNYLTVNQVCERLPVSKTLIYRLINNGTIPSGRLGGKILIAEEDLEKVIHAQGKPAGKSAKESPSDSEFAAFQQKLRKKVANSR